jgi:stage III sporulation protein AC
MNAVINTKGMAENVDVDLIFKIAAVGIMVAVLNLLLSRSGRDEQALMTTIAGLVVVLIVIIREISGLFDLIKSLFGF